MREQVVITPVNITKAGEVRFFQIRLPKNSRQIIGIEIGGRRISKGENGALLFPLQPPIIKEPGIFASMSSTLDWLTFKRNTFIGELKLQSCEQANIFFAADIQTDENLGFGDFSQNSKWQAIVFSHQSKTEEDTVKVNGDTTIVQGIYKDRLGEQSKTDVQYIVNVYVWVEIEDESANKKETSEK